MLSCSVSCLVQGDIYFLWGANYTIPICGDKDKYSWIVGKDLTGLVN